MRSRWWMPAGFLAVFCLTGGAVWWSWLTFLEVRQEREQARINTAADLVKQQVEAQLVVQFRIVRALADILARNRQQTYSDTFDMLGPSTRATYRVIAGLMLSDVEGRVHRVYPPTMKPWLGTNIFVGEESVRRSDLEGYLRAGAGTMSTVMRAADGQRILLFHQPIMRDGQFASAISCMFYVQELMESIIDPQTRQDYKLSFENKRIVVYEHPRDVAAALTSGGAVTREVAVSRSGRWTLRIEPTHTTPLSVVDHLPFALALLLSTGLSLALPLTLRHWLAAREAAARLRGEVERRTTLLTELNHRVRNNLAGVIGLLQQSRGGASPDAVDDTIHRVMALGLVQNMLSSSDWADVPLRELVDGVCRLAARRRAAAIDLRIDDTVASLRVSPARANALALGLYELADLSMQRLGRGGLLRVTARDAAGETHVLFDCDVSENPGELSGNRRLAGAHWFPLDGLLRHELGGRLFSEATGGHDLLGLSMRLDADATPRPGRVG